MIVPDGYTCKFCARVFKREVNFEKHKCDSMLRDEQSKSTRGYAAYNLYISWLKCKKRKAVNKKTFATSKLFSHFYKFAHWNNAVKLPDTKKYISAMVMWKFDPVMWCRDDVYSKYIDFIDQTSNVEDHLRYTYNTLAKVAQTVECNLNQTFDYLELYMVLEYIQARKLSPWVLIKIPAFKRFFSKLNSFQKQKLEQFIRPSYWGEYIKQHPNETKLIVEFIEKAKL